MARRDLDQREERAAEQAPAPAQAPALDAPTDALSTASHAARGPAGTLTRDGVAAISRVAGNAAASAAVARYRADTLPPATAAKMESAFSRSFSDVRIHAESPKASGSTYAVTEGADVHFAPGRFAPGTGRGDWLIGHELAHVVQQSRGGAGAQAYEGRSAGPLEAEADKAASAAAAGRPATVALAAPHGVRQGYEAWEHRDLGDAYGGGARTVTVNCGITLTYGQVVALSGDFYRSPEALMNAPREELEGILAVMARERMQARNSPTGAPTGEQVAANNAAYERATMGSERASHHEHTPFGDDHDHEGEGHEGHGHEGHGHEDEDHEGHDHGRVENGEHVEDAPGADTPSPEATFLELADANASHFSPENIRNNYKPKHRLALDLAKSAWRARNPSAPEPAPLAEGAADSAREGTLPATGRTPEGAPAPDDTSRAGPDTQAGNADVNSAAAGQRQEAMAWLSDGFAAHYLTDAFAGGHLVSGIVGRKVGEEFVRTNRAAIRDALKSCIMQDLGLPDSLADWAADKAIGQVDSKAGSLALKLVHDRLNASGVLVKNALGTEWNSVGDATLQNPQAPGSGETRAQGELSAKASRDSVEDVLRDGTTTRAMAALDYIPDVAKLPDFGDYQPIESFSGDRAMLEHFYGEAMLSGDPAQNRLYQLAKSNIGILPVILERDAIRWIRTKWGELKDVAWGAWEGLKNKARSAMGWLEERAEEVGEAASGLWGRLRGAARGVGGWLSDRARDVGEAASGAADWVGEQTAPARRAVGEAASGAWGWLTERAGEARQAASGAASWVAEQTAPARRWAADRASDVGEAASSAWGWLGDRARDVGQAASGAADWVGEQTAPARQWVGDRASEVGEAASGAASFLADKARQAGGWVAERAREVYASGRTLVGQATESARSIWAGVKSLAGRARTAIAHGVSNTIDWAQGLWDSEVDEDPAELQPRDVAISDVQNQTYAHGGFMGAGPQFMADPHWRTIFETVMPDEYARVSRLTDSAEVMAALENNPVLAAYGSVRHLDEVASRQSDPGRQGPLPLEWDVWLPPDHRRATDLDAVRIAHGNLGTTIGQQVAGGGALGMQRDEVLRQSSGSEWLQRFGQAVSLHRGGAETESDPGAAQARESAIERLRSQVPAEQALGVAMEFLREPGGLYLDVKSTYSTPEDIAMFVQMLEQRGIRVIGVGTFAFGQLERLPDRVARVKFFHGIEDLENGWEDGELHANNRILFNGGTLLSKALTSDEYSLDRDAIQRLRAIADEFHDRTGQRLQLGIYVQETDVSPEAAQILTELVNSERDLFPQGFAYGNVSGRSEGTVSGTGLGAQRMADLLEALRP